MSVSAKSSIRPKLDNEELYVDHYLYFSLFPFPYYFPACHRQKREHTNNICLSNKIFVLFGLSKLSFPMIVPNDHFTF